MYQVPGFPPFEASSRGRQTNGPTELIDQEVNTISTNFPSRSRRPIDREITVIAKNAVGTTQVSTVFRTAIVAETLIRTVGNVNFVLGANASNFGFMIIISRDGLSAVSISLADGTTMYAPEENVLYAYRGRVLAGYVIEAHFDIKGQRKLKPGDEILAIMEGASADTFDAHGVVTTFFKQ